MLRSGTSRPLITLLALATTALLAASPVRAGAGDPEVTAITAAPPLTWGFKQSWRSYAGLPQIAAGATVESTGLGSYDIKWAFEGGSYDAAAGTTKLAYDGSIHWQKYRASFLGWTPPPGYKGSDPDPYILDLILADPEVSIGRDSSTITAAVSARNQATWEMVDFGRIPVVDLNVLGITPTTAAGTTAWTGIPATISTNAALAFTYQAGQVADEIAFSYSGPGGAPDFSERWDTPGAAKLKLVQNQLFVNSEEKISLASLVERENLLVHSLREVNDKGVLSRRLEAFDLEQMTTVGTPLTLINKQAPLPGRIIAHDTNEDRWIYRGATASEAGITRWIRFDAETGYETGVLPDPQMADPSFVGQPGQRLAWDPTRDRGYRVDRIVPDGVGEEDFDQHQWQLLTYAEGEDGTWTRKSFDLPGFGSGQNASGYDVNFTYEKPTYATASDGSLIVLATARDGLDPTHPAPATMPGAYRLTFDAGDTAVDLQPLPVEVPNTANGPFTSVQTSANGHILLSNYIGDGDVVHCQVEADAVECDDPASVTDNVEVGFLSNEQFAIDPADGIVWFGGALTQKMAAFGDGAFLGGEFFKERNPRGGPVLVGDDHVVYAQTSDGGPREIAGSKTWGYGKFERVGFVPAVTAQPQSKTVALAADEPSADASFESAASGEPAPSRQWQLRTAGSASFADIPGETSATLEVEATRAMNGSEYRAVYSNVAGRIASEPATLEVLYAPQLLVDANDVAVAVGEEAEFSVRPAGNPEPAVSWQRRVNGFWQVIAPDDDNFTIGEATLTVDETNAEQSGTLFRAKLTSSQGAVFSRTAKLTVKAPAPGPLEDVSLDWAGSPELQKAPPFGGSNYFSAGPSDGDEATYRARAGNAIVYQLSATGTETIASWSTRASHVLNGGKQLARLYGGEGELEADGSARVEWDGAFSVNFYGGMVPFTLSDPVLTVDASGAGALSADLSGFASSKENPSERSPLAPIADVTVATFSDVEIDPAGEIAITPAYDGVETTVPAGFTPQSRSGDWGAWPQPFVDFHLKTGLLSYWYSSGGAADPLKRPLPIVVDFDGEALPPEPVPSGDPATTPQPPQAQLRAPDEPATILASRAAQAVDAKRRVRVATLSCPPVSACEVLAPWQVGVRIAGRFYRAWVLAPRSLPAGASAAVRVRLPRRALKALGEGRASLRVRLLIDSDAGSAEQTVKVQITG